MASPLRIGVIGCGIQGHALIDSTNRIEAPFRPRITALCDPWPLARKSALELIQRGRARDAEPTKVGEYSELSDEFFDKVDAVLIASPDYLHESQALQCLRNGKHVYLEPPMAMTAAGAKSLVEAAEEKKVQLQIGYYRRSHPNYRFAMGKEFRADMYGLLNIVKTYYSVPVPRPQLHNADPDLAVPQRALETLGFEDMDAFIGWRNSDRCYAGYLRNEVSHQIDATRWALGKPMAAIASGVCVFSESGCLDRVDSILEFPFGEGKIARAANHLQVGNSLPGQIDVFHGTHGSVVINEACGSAYLCPETHADRDNLRRGEVARKLERRFQPAGMTSEQYRTYLRNLRNSRQFSCTAGTSGSIYDNSHYFKDPFSRPLFRAHLDNFFQAIESAPRGASALHCSGREGYDTTLVCLAIEKAAGEGIRVEFDPNEWLTSLS